MAVMTQPSQLSTSVKLLYELADGVWKSVGDDSTGVNFYSKRALLTGVYTASELYMLTDFSPGHADTWQAITRRLEDVVAAGKGAAQLGQQFKGAMDRLSQMRR